MIHLLPVRSGVYEVSSLWKRYQMHLVKKKGRMIVVNGFLWALQTFIT